LSKTSISFENTLSKSIDILLKCVRNIEILKDIVKSIDILLKCVRNVEILRDIVKKHWSPDEVITSTQRSTLCSVLYFRICVKNWMSLRNQFEKKFSNYWCHLNFCNCWPTFLVSISRHMMAMKNKTFKFFVSKKSFLKRPTFVELDFEGTKI
jgi:hypothetical protein